MSKQQTDLSSHLEQQARALRSKASQPHPAKRPARPAGVPVPDGSPPAPEPPRARRRFPLLLVAANLLLLAVIALGVMYFRDQERQSMMEVRYVVPGRDDICEEVVYGNLAVLHDPVEIRNFTFLGWEDEQGSMEKRAEFPVYRNTVYTARYLPAFRERSHIPYLIPDEEGMLHPAETVTMREFVHILCLLLDTDLTGSGRFADVSEEDSCYEEAALLKDLGILEGNLLHPDETLCRGEMIRILCRFFPEEETDPLVFQDLDKSSEYYPSFCAAAAKGWIASGILVRASATSEIHRGEFARIMNHVLGRDASRHLKLSSVGTILDVPPTSDYYDELAEASIPHQYNIVHGEERWITSEPLPLHKPGPFFSGVKLHYVDEDGNPVANAALGGLTFNQNGEITTGDSDLDRMLWEVMEDLINPEEMKPEEMLRAVYDYVVENYRYRIGGVYARGAEGWAAKEALRMLRNHSGNCYCFAALFYELARFVGYDANIYAGLVYGEQQVYAAEDGSRVYAPQAYTPHGWVEITIDGIDYIFDAEFEAKSGGLLKMFMVTDKARMQFAYSK